MAKSTGTYVYDEKLGRVVKVSDRVPGLKKGRAPETGPCGKPASYCGSRGCGS